MSEDTEDILSYYNSVVSPEVRNRVALLKSRIAALEQQVAGLKETLEKIPKIIGAGSADKVVLYAILSTIRKVVAEALSKLEQEKPE